jgi:hypothetical protein
MKQITERIADLKATIKALKENDLDTTAAYQKLHLLEDEYEQFNRPGMYNGPTAVQVCYQWHMMNEGGDEVVLSNEYPTAQEAFEAMRRCMPDCRKFDDGDDLKDWQALIDNGDGDEVFIQHCAQIDAEHNLLARLWPVINKEEA